MIEKKLTRGEELELKKQQYIFQENGNERATWPRYGDQMGEARSASPITESRAGVNPETRRVTEYYYSMPVDRLYTAVAESPRLSSTFATKNRGRCNTSGKGKPITARADPILIAYREFNRVAVLNYFAAHVKRDT